MSPESAELVRTIVYFLIGFGAGYAYGKFRKWKATRRKGEFSLLYKRPKDKDIDKL